MGIRLKCSGLVSSHEEAYHIPVQLYPGEKVRIIYDDIHVLILFPHLYVYNTFTRALHLNSPVANRSIVDPGATFQKNKDTTKTVLVIHVLPGADTVTATYNVDKQLALKAM